MMHIVGWAADPHALEEFLEEPNLARIGTLDAQGDVHIVAVWFHWDGERFWVGSQAGDHKVDNIRRTGRASIEVDGDLRRKRGILARGSARLVEGSAGRAAYERISEPQVRRYQPDRPPHETAQRMAARGEPVVIELRPGSIVSWGR
jgi:PPOX class probable F420-dependent enzyme